MKACFKCKHFKTLDDFYTHPAMADGHSGKCKECTKADVRANYREHLDRYKEYERGRSMLQHRVEARERYLATPAGKQRSMASKRSYMERNPAKRKAHILCGNAIRDGLLIREPCEICGHQKAQAHHDDYGKPLDVRWLCTKHHRDWHRENIPKCTNQHRVSLALIEHRTDTSSGELNA